MKILGNSSWFIGRNKREENLFLFDSEFLLWFTVFSLIEFQEATNDN